jgi:hypothetical protein
VDAQKLVGAVAELRPDQPATEHLRIALLLSTQQPDLAASLEACELERLCTDVAIQLSAASDQHAAVAGELDSLALTTPCEFTADHLWSLIRALKVQGRILDLYLGPVLCPSPPTLA